MENIIYNKKLFNYQIIIFSLILRIVFTYYSHSTLINCIFSCNLCWLWRFFFAGFTPIPDMDINMNFLSYSSLYFSIFLKVLLFQVWLVTCDLVIESRLTTPTHIDARKPNRKRKKIYKIYLTINFTHYVNIKLKDSLHAVYNRKHKTVLLYLKQTLYNI